MVTGAGRGFGRAIAARLARRGHFVLATDVDGRSALLVGFRPGEIECSDYRVVARIAMPVDNEERDAPVARCTLDRPLAELWPQIVALYD